MSIIEFVLVFALLVLYLVPAFFPRKITQPYTAIIKLACVLGVLVEIWFFADGAKTFPKIVLTVFMVINIIRVAREYLAYKQQAKYGLE